EGDKTISRKEGMIQILQGDFLAILSEKLKHFTQEKGHFPFENGGAFGCLGYEMAGLIEPRLMKSGQFKSLAGSNESVAEIFFSKNLIIFEHAQNRIHLALKDLKINLQDFRSKEIP